MDDSKRKLLEKKRIELSHEREKDDRKRLVSDFVATLDSNAIAYRMIIDDLVDKTTPRNWVVNNFHFFDWGRIDWGQVDKCYQVNVHDYDEGTSELFCRLLSDNELKNPTVFVFWNDSSMPMMSLKLKDLAEVAYDAFEEAWDTWVSCPDEGWCIEYHHDGDLSFGRVTN